MNSQELSSFSCFSMFNYALYTLNFPAVSKLYTLNSKLSSSFVSFFQSLRLVKAAGPITGF